MAIPPTPFAAYSKGPGLTELVRLYVCGLQPRPSVQLSSSSMSLTDDEYSPESGPRGKASDRSRWVFASMATPLTRSLLIPRGPGLTELVRLYVCGLQLRPSVQLSSSSMSLTDDECSSRSGPRGNASDPS